jgi:phage FluMu gp28-like protein
MKKIILLLLIASVVSCKKSDTSTPAAGPVSGSGSTFSLTVNPSANRAKAGDQVTFGVNVASSNTLTTIVVMQSVNGAAPTQVNSHDITSKNQTTYSYTENYTVPTGVTGRVAVSWIASDSKGKTVTTEDTITISSPVSVTVTPPTRQVNAGDDASFRVDMSSSDDLSKIVVMQTSGGSTNEFNEYTIPKGKTTYSYIEEYPVPTGSSSPITLTWIVTDSKNNTNSAMATLTY